MKISEVMEFTRLTKKAINYYEEEGLITCLPGKNVTRNSSKLVNSVVAGIFIYLFTSLH